MTAVIRYTGAGWDSSLPAAPKPGLTFGFKVNHEYTAESIPGGAGTAVTSWADLRGSVPLTNAVGGVLRSDVGGGKYIQLSGISGSLAGTFTAGTTRTLILVARVNAGDVLSGAGPIAGFQATDGIVQLDADTAALKVTAKDANLPARRGYWHMYAVTVPETGAGLVGVDSASVAFQPFVSVLDRLSLGILGSDRRALQIAHVLTSPDALSAAQLKTTFQTLRGYYPELTFI